MQSSGDFKLAMPVLVMGALACRNFSKQGYGPQTKAL